MATPSRAAVACVSSAAMLNLRGASSLGRSLGLSPSMPVFSLPERDAATADRSNRLLASVVCAHEPDKEEEAAAAEEEAAAASSKAVSRIIGGRVGGRGKPKPRQVTG